MTIARRVRGGMLALGLIAGLSNFAICQEPKAPEAQPAIPLAPVLTKRYTWAEVESAMVLVRELRATTPQVQSSLNEWYNLIADPNFTESQDVPEHCVKLGVWTKSRPDSPIPLLAQGKARLNHAWHLRGNGFSSEVSATGQEAFRAELVKSREFIEQAIKLGVKDGEAHALLIDLARAEGRPLTEVRAILDAGRAIDPSYVWLYSAMAEYLLPRWYGKLGDIEKFAAEVVQMLPGEDGLDAYGHIAYIVNQYDANVLFWGGYDRELLVKGAEVLVPQFLFD